VKLYSEIGRVNKPSLRRCYGVLKCCEHGFSPPTLFGAQWY
jgi:hypothetical protein